MKKVKLKERRWLAQDHTVSWRATWIRNGLSGWCSFQGLKVQWTTVVPALFCLFCFYCCCCVNVTTSSWSESIKTGTSLAVQWLRLCLPALGVRSFPGGSISKESACNSGDLGSIPGLGRFPWRKEWLHIPVFLPGELHGQRSLAGYSPWYCKESDTTEWLNTHTHTYQGMLPHHS